MFLVERIFPATFAFFIIVPLSLLIIFLSSKKIKVNYDRIEERFFSNLNDRETASKRCKKLKPELASIAADIHIVEMEVNPDSPFVGGRLSELAWRENYGINVVYVERGGKITRTPGGNQCIFPFDKVGVIGTDAQIDTFKKVFEIERKHAPDILTSDIVPYKLIVDELHDYRGKMIKETPIYTKIKGIVIRIDRDNQGITNPLSTFVLEEGDVVWFVGLHDKIKRLFG